MKFIEFGTGQGYLKAGFLGFPKSGKTFTSALLAIETRKRFKSDKAIAIFDTETGAEYIAPMIKKATGKNPVGVKSRSLSDLLEMAKDCEKKEASCLIVDSITHVWREVCDSYLSQVNKVREQKGQGKRTRLEFQDWATIKGIWQRWTEFYLNSKLNIIICGRAGYEWDFEEKEDATGNVHKELMKTGVKMKVESEFGFEPSLLIQMERVQTPRGDTFSFTHRATVLGDRFNVMDGAEKENPDGAWFAPFLDRLVIGAVNTVDTTAQTDMEVDDAGDLAFNKERKTRTILCEEIEGELTKVYPGQTKEEKQAKVNLLQQAFGTTSWTAIEAMTSEKLKGGLVNIKILLKEVPK